MPTAGYPTPNSLQDADNAGVKLNAPVHRGRMSDEIMSRQDFESDPTYPQPAKFCTVRRNIVQHAMTLATPLQSGFHRCEPKPHGFQRPNDTRPMAMVCVGTRRRDFANSAPYVGITTALHTSAPQARAQLSTSGQKPDEQLPSQTTTRRPDWVCEILSYRR